MNAADTDITQRDVDLIISKILRIGLLSAASIMVLGAALNFAQNKGAELDLRHFHGEPEHLRTIFGIVKATLQGDSRAIMQLAIVVLLATPFLRVLFAIYAFSQQGDKRFVVISAIVLVVLVVGLVLGVQAG